MMRGRFITFEGPDGAGKSTQARLLNQYLRDLGLQVLLTREPGGTRLAEGIRAILLDPGSDVTPEAELFLYAAARAQHVTEVIEPALASGKIVICDRFVDSSIAYQGYGRGLDPAQIWHINLLAAKDLVPDLTILLDGDVELGISRINRQRGQDGTSGLDRLEQESLGFHQRVREGYLSWAGQHPGRIRVVSVSADSSPIQVFQQVKHLIRAVLP